METNYIKRSQTDLALMAFRAASLLSCHRECSNLYAAVTNCTGLHALAWEKKYFI